MDKILRCFWPKCDYKTKYKHHLNAHQLVHSDLRPFKCDFDNCNKSFKSELKLNNHNNHVHIKRFVCDCSECGKVLKSKSNLIRHKVLVHSYPDKSHTYFNCFWPKCQFKTTTESMLITHQLKHSDIKQFKCDFNNCNKLYKYKHHLDRHQNSTHFNKKYVCDFNECYKTFTENKSLIRHKNRVHLNERKFKCNEENCDKIFKSKQTLLRHKSCHLGEKTFHCYFKGCIESFKYRSQLSKHSNNVHNIDIPFVCGFSECDKVYKSKYNLIRHNLTVHSYLDKNNVYFQCFWPKCQFKAITKSMLKEHQLKHSAIKQFKCDFDNCNKKYVCDFNECYKTFTENKSLIRHKNSVHLNKRKFKCNEQNCDKIFQSKQHLLHHRRCHSGEKPFHCHFNGCNKSFAYKQHFKVHKNRHLDIKNHKCYYDNCSQQFVTRSELKRHIMRVHRWILRLNDCPDSCVDNTDADEKRTGLDKIVESLSLADYFKCRICLQVLNKTLVTRCGHTFCHECLNEWLSRSQTTKECFECRQPLATRKRARNQTISDNEAIIGGNDFVNSNPLIDEIIGKLKIRCDYEWNGCPEVCPLESLSTHLKTCQHKLCQTCGLSVGLVKDDHNCIEGLKTDRNEWQTKCNEKDREFDIKTKEMETKIKELETKLEKCEKKSRHLEMKYKQSISGALHKELVQKCKDLETSAKTSTVVAKQEIPLAVIPKSLFFGKYETNVGSIEFQKYDRSLRCIIIELRDVLNETFVSQLYKKCVANNNVNVKYEIISPDTAQLMLEKAKNGIN
ncbi:unnamed protein product, partial [Medioppia subpectinata]